MQQMCVPQTFFFSLSFLSYFFSPHFAFSYPSPVQTQMRCWAYELWQLYRSGLDGYRHMFFLDSTKTPGNKLTDSRMIFKGYPLPHPALTPEPQKSVRNATEFLLRNSAKKKYYQRGSLKTLCLTRERQDKKQDLGDKSHLGMGTQRLL